MCVCVCEYSMTLNANEKNWLFVFVDKIISLMVVLYAVCQTPKIDVVH